MENMKNFLESYSFNLKEMEPVYNDMWKFLMNKPYVLEYLSDTTDIWDDEDTNLNGTVEFEILRPMSPEYIALAVFDAFEEIYEHYYPIFNVFKNAQIHNLDWKFNFEWKDGWLDYSIEGSNPEEDKEIMEYWLNLIGEG